MTSQVTMVSDFTKFKLTEVHQEKGKQRFLSTGLYYSPLKFHGRHSNYKSHLLCTSYLAIVATVCCLWTVFLIPSAISTYHYNQHQSYLTYSPPPSRKNASVAHKNNNNHGTRHGRNSLNDSSDGSQNSPPALVLKPEHFNIPLGGVIHLFPRYGYFHLSMKVISKTEKAPTNHTSVSTSGSVSSKTASTKNESWLFLEPVNNVVEPTTLTVEESSISPQNDSNSLPFHNLFHIDLCEDVRELMEAYFKNFTIEGLDKPWQAFSGGWRVPTIARYFGIDQTYVEGDYRFILVKVLLVRGSGYVIPTENTTVSSLYHPNFVKFIPNNDLSTYEFFKIVGTHYVHGYIMGNALYQVFVYDADGFHKVKQRLFYDGIKHLKTSEFIQKLPETLSLWVKHTGKVFVLNSTPETLEAVRKSLSMYTVRTGSTANIFKLHNNSSLVHQIELMLANQPNGLLGIDLRGIHFLFTDPIQRAGFEKALKHKLQLWEINFQY